MTETFINEQINALQEHYSEREAQFILRILLEDCFGLKWKQRYKSNLTTQEYTILHSAMNALLDGKPIQYITGKAHFFGYEFAVDKSVLIPRPETEELVEQALRLGSLFHHKAVRVLDVGTGSGCIPITLKKERPEWEVSALEVSAGALKLAIRNAKTLAAEVAFIEMDFIDSANWESLGGYDLILSNPPYIPQAEKNLVGRNVLGQEPDLALFVDDDDPLLFYRLLTAFGQSHLNKKGHLLVETNQYNAQEVVQLFRKAGYEGVELLKDFMGEDRMVRAIKGLL